jgi:hypothetical protein
MEPIKDTSQLERTFALQGGLSAALVAGLGAVLVIEGAVLHLWIASRSEAWAWAITVLNAATLVWLWRDYQAGTRSRLSIDGQRVGITIGNRMRCRFERSNIASAEQATWRSVPDLPPSDYVNTAKPLEPNVTIVLNEPADARLPFGIRKRYARIGIRVGDPETVLAALRGPIASSQTQN